MSLDWTRIIHIYIPPSSLYSDESDLESEDSWVNLSSSPVDSDDEYVFIKTSLREPTLEKWPTVEKCWPSVKKRPNDSSPSILSSSDESGVEEEDESTKCVDLRSCGADLDQALLTPRFEEEESDSHWQQLQKWETLAARQIRKDPALDFYNQRRGGRRKSRSIYPRKFRYQSNYVTKHQEKSRKAAHKRLMEKEETAWVDPKKQKTHKTVGVPQGGAAVAAGTVKEKRGARAILARERKALKALRRAGRAAALAFGHDYKAWAARDASVAAPTIINTPSSSSPFLFTNTRWTNRRIAAPENNQNLDGTIRGHHSTTLTLYHGTTATASAKILAQGFRVPTGVNRDRMTGKPLLFGNAIYFAMDQSKARLFGSLVLRCEVKVGCSLIKTTPSPSMTKHTLDGLSCHSINGLSGGTLNRPEYAIYDPAQVLSITRAKTS